MAQHGTAVEHSDAAVISKTCAICCFVVLYIYMILVQWHSSTSIDEHLGDKFLYLAQSTSL